jgi:hypothetical protein
MRSTSTFLPRSSLEESALTSMRMDRIFLRIEEKTLPLHGGCHWSPPTWPKRACTASSLRTTKNRPLPWSAKKDARGRRARTAPLHHRGTSLSWGGGGGGQHQGRRTRMWPRGLILVEPPPRVASHMCDGDDECRSRKGIEGGRKGRTFIIKVRMRK